jgi:L-asparaginase II
MRFYPWSPIYTTFRTGLAETTLYGIVNTRSEASLLQVGDVDFPIWGRSLLKPWQLMVIYPALRKAYPSLEGRHYALMMASQQSDPQQVEALREILAIGALSEEQLQCPACSPMKESNKNIVGSAQTPLNHPCSGKHLGYLLYAKVQNQPLDSYLQPQTEPYQLTRKLFGYLLGRDFLSATETIDGCGMPNMALSAAELAQLYQWLANGLPENLLRNAPGELALILQSWDAIAQIMRAHPEFVGGQNRLDTRLMQGQWAVESGLRTTAKEGAEGLLGVGIGPTARFPEGMGILIKLSSGYDLAVLETIVFALLRQAGLCKPLPRKLEREVQIEFQLTPTSPEFL